MTYDCNWGKTPLYTKHIAENGEGAPFMDEQGNLPYPLGGIMWGMMIAKEWSITPKNAGEVYARLATYYKVTGSRFYTSWDDDSKEFVDIPIKPSDVAQSMWLSTNAGKSSRADFVKHMVNLTKRTTEPASPQDIKRIMDEFLDEFNTFAVEAMIAQEVK